jgi:hypothetical protein
MMKIEKKRKEKKKIQVATRSPTNHVCRNQPECLVQRFGVNTARDGNT